MGELEEIKEVENLLGVFDSSNQKISEAEIFDALDKFAKEKYSGNKLSLPDCLEFEMMFFMFVEDYTNEASGWGTYYGPFATFNDKEKGYVEVPSIKDITPSIIDYWEKRAIESKNPILKAHYADLVWDFSEKIKGVKPNKGQWT